MRHRFVRRVTAVAVTAVLLTGGGPMHAAAASVEIQAGPKKVRVSHAYEKVSWRLTGVDWSQDRYEWCSITLEHKATRAYVDSTYADSANTGTLRVDDYMVRPGVHQVIADCYFSGRAVDELTIKFGARARITKATRSGRAVTLVGNIRRWSAMDTRFTGWSQAPVRVQKKTSGGWRTVTTVRSGRGGRVSAQVRSRRPVAWRFVTPANTSTWSSRSPIVRR
jgi:hypothetical protein